MGLPAKPIEVRLDQNVSIDVPLSIDRPYLPPERLPRDVITANMSPYWQPFYHPYGGTGSTGEKWSHGLSATGQSPILNHWFLRQNARSAFHENMVARAIVERYADCIVDVGLRLEANPQAEILGMPPEQAESWSREVEEKFHNWAADKKCSRDETMNFYQMQRLAAIFQHRDNDYFVRFHYSPRRDLQNPLQLQFIDPSQVRGTEYTNTYGYQYNKNDGIIRDVTGREVAYKIFIQKPDFTFQEIVVPRIGAKSGRLFMVHGFQPEYAGQGRGYSRLAHAIQEFENLTDFSSATIMKAINQANIAMYTKPSVDNAASNPFAEITHGGAGPIPTIDETTDPATLAASISEPVRYIPIPEATMTKPGSVGVYSLQEGEDLKPFPETSPSDSFPVFVDAFCSYLCSSLSIPIEILLMKFGQNYSASRGALIMFWRVCQYWQMELATDFLNPVFESWLAGEIANGRINAPGWMDPRLKAAWLNKNWIGAPMPNIDPQKTAKADQIYASLGAQTLDRIARNLNGSSGQANRAKLTRELDELPQVPWNTKGTGGGFGGQ